MLNEAGPIVLTTPHPSYEWIFQLGGNLSLFAKESYEQHQNLLDFDRKMKLTQEADLKMLSYRGFILGANQLVILEK